MTDYTIEQGSGVRERMNLLAAVCAPATLALLDAIAIPEGAQCIDVGCGGGHVALELGRRVGPSGRVVGIDLDQALLELVRRDAEAEGLDNVTFRVAPAEDLAESGLDLAFSRLLLMHLRDPGRVVRLMAEAVRPGGTVVVEDANFSGCFTSPPCPAYDHWAAWYRETVRRTGGDPDLGLRLAELLRSAGLVDVQVRVAQYAALDGRNKQLQQVSMAKQRAAILAAGVAGADEYDAAHAELQAFTNDPTTLVAGPRIIQAWARRP